MNTAPQAIDHLQQALSAARAAQGVIDDLIVAHDYQDVASLVTEAAAALLDAAARLMQMDDEAAFDLIERAEDILDQVYEIIESDLDEA